MTCQLSKFLLQDIRNTFSDKNKQHPNTGGGIEAIIQQGHVVAQAGQETWRHRQGGSHSSELQVVCDDSPSAYQNISISQNFTKSQNLLRLSISRLSTSRLLFTFFTFLLENGIPHVKIQPSSRNGQDGSENMIV